MADPLPRVAAPVIVTIGTDGAARWVCPGCSALCCERGVTAEEIAADALCCLCRPIDDPGLAAAVVDRRRGRS